MDLKTKKKEFIKLYSTGKYTQKEIAIEIGISEQSLVQWIKDIPAFQYQRIRVNLAKELERLSASPAGNEELIFKYIQHLSMLDIMVRKAKYLPEN